MFNQFHNPIKKVTLFCLFGLLMTLNPKSYATESNDWNLSSTNWHLDIGGSFLKIKVIDDFSAPPPEYGVGKLSPLLGVGVMKKINNTSLVGTKIEFQRVEGSLLTTFRAIDYRYIVNQNWQLGAHLGAARYNFRSPAYGYTTGFGAFFRQNKWRDWHIGLEVQFMDKLARDKIHPDDKPATAATGPDTFTNMAGIALTYSRYF